MARPAGSTQANFPSSRPGIVFRARARERARNDPPPRRRYRDPAATPPLVGSARSAEKTLLFAREDRRSTRDRCRRWQISACVLIQREYIAARELKFTSKLTPSALPPRAESRVARSKRGSRSINVSFLVSRTDYELLPVYDDICTPLLICRKLYRRYSYIKFRNNRWITYSNSCVIDVTVSEWQEDYTNEWLDNDY